MALKINDKAPDFTLPSTAGSSFTLSRDMADKPCILYFYPRDFTPGCTKEACEFRDQFAEFRTVDIDVLGISRDTLLTHEKFRQQHQLPFHLLSDISGSVAKSYKAIVPVIGLTMRITYLLDANHHIAAVYDSMFDARGHVEQMIEKIKATKK